MVDTPTQVAHPWRAAIRTGIQTFLAAATVLVLVAPEVQTFIDEWWPGSPVAAWIGAVAAFIGAFAVLITRIMAIPAVNDLLTRLGIGPAPEVKE